MNLIYQNFDGLDVAFQGTVSESILNQLEAGRKSAKDSPRGQTDALVKLGKGEVPVMVASTGMRGGYRYRFDTGLDGEIWCIADSDNPKYWNIRVSVKSLSLALYGYEGVKERLYAMLEKMEAKGSGEINNKTGEIYEVPKESISRVDYCFDFKSDNFLIDPNCIIAHSRANKQFVYPQEFVSTGRQINYCRIGSMPNKQVVIYNKTLEVKQKNKPYWWKVWGIEKESFNSKIWRLEVRAGKKELKNWPIRSFDAFEEKVGDLISSILKEIKYVVFNPNDSNKARQPLEEFWITAQKATNQALAQYISNAKRNPVIEEYKNDLINRYKNQMSGMIPAYSAILGKTDAALIPAVLEGLFNEFSETAKENKGKLQIKIEKAKNKFVFLDKI